MSRYFFDIHDAGKVQKDEIGTEFTSLDEVRKAAMHLLPDIWRDRSPVDEDHRSIIVVVSDEDERPIYSAILSCTGLWLLR